MSKNMVTWQNMVMIMMMMMLFCTGGVCGWSVGSNGVVNDGVGSDGDSVVLKRQPRHIVPPSTAPTPTLPPVFDPSTPTNITVTATKTAMLSCIVHNLGNNSVSWIRHRDLHILSVGMITYTNDGRFEVVPQIHKGNWMMRLRYAAPRDTGQYDCQISSTPHIATTVMLTVIEPRAKILSAPEMHVGVGSAINLTCVVPYSPQPPDYLHWYYNDRMVRDDGERVWVRTQLAEMSVSQLVIKDAVPSDQGVYICNPAHTIEHYITVHIITGEYPAAMQGGSSVTCHGQKRCCLVTLLAMAIFVGFYM